MQEGYAVLAGDGGTAAGSGQADAARWLEDFTQLKERRDGYRLLYGSPDLAALVRDKQRSVFKTGSDAHRAVERSNRVIAHVDLHVRRARHVRVPRLAGTIQPRVPHQFSEVRRATRS